MGFVAFFFFFLHSPSLFKHSWELYIYIYIYVCVDKISKDFSEEVLVGLSVLVAMGELNCVSLVLLFTIGGSCNNH